MEMLLNFFIPSFGPEFVEENNYKKGKSIKQNLCKNIPYHVMDLSPLQM